MIMKHAKKGVGIAKRIIHTKWGTCTSTKEKKLLKGMASENCLNVLIRP